MILVRLEHVSVASNQHLPGSSPLTRITKLGVTLGHGGNVAVCVGVGSGWVVVVNLSSTVCPPHESSTETIFSSILLSTTARLGSLGRCSSVKSGHFTSLGELETIFEPGSVTEDDFLGGLSVDTVVGSFRVERESLARGELDGTGGEVTDESGATIGGVTRGW